MVSLVSGRHHIKWNLCDGIGYDYRRIVMLEEWDSRLCSTYISADPFSDRLGFYESKLFQFGHGRTNSSAEGGGPPAFILCRNCATQRIGFVRIMEMKWQKTISATAKESAVTHTLHRFQRDVR